MIAGVEQELQSRANLRHAVMPILSTVETVYTIARLMVAAWWHMHVDDRTDIRDVHGSKICNHIHPYPQPSYHTYTLNVQL